MKLYSKAGPIELTSPGELVEDEQLLKMFSDVFNFVLDTFDRSSTPVRPSLQVTPTRDKVQWEEARTPLPPSSATALCRLRSELSSIRNSIEKSQEQSLGPALNHSSSPIVAVTDSLAMVGSPTRSILMLLDGIGGTATIGEQFSFILPIYFATASLYI